MLIFRLMSICAALALGLIALPVAGQAQQKSLRDQILGSWSATSLVDIKADGSKNDQWGPNFKGTMILAPDGHYAFIVVRGDLPKIAANNAKQATPDEAKTITQGMIAYFGTFAVGEADKTVSFKIEGSSFPNLVGAEQKRIITSIGADELKYSNPASASGTRVEGVWKRSK